MKILTPENTSLDVAQIPDQFEDDVRYSVLDLSDHNNYDFYFMPLVYLESFNAPALVLQIGNNYIKVPCIESPNDWKLLIGDSEMGVIEAISVEDLNSTNHVFTAFSFNPISSFSFDFKQVRIVDAFAEMKWYMPTLPPNYVLTVPLASGSKKDCVFLTTGSTGRKIESIEVGEVF